MDLKLRSAALWLVVFICGAAFQLWRGSPIDTIVYTAAALLVLLAVQKRFRTPEYDATQFTIAASPLLLFTSVFIFFPIHSWIVAACYLLLVPVLWRIFWQGETMPLPRSTNAARRSSVIWFALGSLTCVCELGNYFASEITHDDKSFPTLTVLVDPIVANSWGKVAFVVVWAGIGAGLMRVSTKK